eukprot:8004779-Pyramimonas_sp.AAC.1
MGGRMGAARTSMTNQHRSHRQHAADDGIVYSVPYMITCTLGYVVTFYVFMVLLTAVVIMVQSTDQATSEHPLSSITHAPPPSSVTVPRRTLLSNAAGHRKLMTTSPIHDIPHHHVTLHERGRR